eukprot:5783566-Prymnesium_polylepis.1
MQVEVDRQLGALHVRREQRQRELLGERAVDRVAPRRVHLVLVLLERRLDRRMHRDDVLHLRRSTRTHMKYTSTRDEQMHESSAVDTAMRTRALVWFEEHSTDTRPLAGL